MKRGCWNGITPEEGKLLVVVDRETLPEQTDAYTLDYKYKTHTGTRQLNMGRSCREGTLGVLGGIVLILGS